MSVISKAIYNALIADAPLAALLSSYDAVGSQGPLPALFSGDPIPEDAVAPFGVIRGPISQEPVLDQNDSIGRSAIYDVAFYDDSQQGSSKRVDDIAERARAVLHRGMLEIGGATHVDSRCSGPIQNDETDLFGRVLTVRVLADLI